MGLFVGTSGWAYREWKPAFYPRDVPQARFLEHYATRMSACEINATFYRLQSDATLTRWAEATPESFRFAAKAHRGITHSKSLAPDAERKGLLDAFLASVGLLGPRLGVVLFQFPPYRRRDDDALRSFLGALPPGAGYVLEFRHESWDDPAVTRAIAEAGAGLCLSETTGRVPGSLPPGPVGYVRLRHDRYSEEARTGWAELLVEEAAIRDVYAFAKHEGIPPGDPFGGVGLAQWLTEHCA